VTAGVGLLLADAQAATRLPFRIGERAAEPKEIATEFARVDGLPMGRPAQFYRRTGGPELSSEAMETLLRAVVVGIETELSARVNGFAGMPDGVKTALLDMAYGLGLGGPGGLMIGYPRLLRAVQVGDWKSAAATSFRPGAIAGRNEWTRGMFLGKLTEAPGEGKMKRLGYGCVGIVASWFGK
jgi:hypothetical protein